MCIVVVEVADKADKHGHAHGHSGAKIKPHILAVVVQTLSCPTSHPPRPRTWHKDRSDMRKALLAASMFGGPNHSRQLRQYPQQKSVALSRSARNACKRPSPSTRCSWSLFGASKPCWSMQLECANQVQQGHARANSELSPLVLLHKWHLPSSNSKFPFCVLPFSSCRWCSNRCK